MSWLPVQKKKGICSRSTFRFELGPLEGPLAGVLAVTLDEVADRHHEFGLQQVDHSHGPRENAGPMASRAVGDDGEAKGVGSLVELELRPRIPRSRVGYERRL